MGDVNWSLLQMPDIRQAFQQGYERKAQQNALAAYAQDPQNGQALNALAQYQPDYVIKQKQLEAHNQLEQQQLQAKAGQERGVERTKYVGQAALRISQLPPEQQPAAWDQAVAQGVQMGHPELAQYQGHYSLELLNATLAAAGLTDKAMEYQQPKYMPIPAGGTLVDTRNPQAVASFGASGAQPASGATPPPAAVDHLRQNPALRDAFDAKYGAGASARALGQGGPQVSPAATFRP